RGAARRPARPRLRAAPAGRAAEGAATGRNHDRRRARSGAGYRRARRRGRGRSRRRGGGGSGGRGGGGGGGGGRGGSRGRPGRRRAARRGGRRRGGGCVAHGPHEGGAALAATPAERIHVAVPEAHVPRVPRVGDAGRRRPVVAQAGAAARRRLAARRAVGVERRGHDRVEGLVVHDALQLPHVRQPPIVVAREVQGVERRHVPREGVGPRVEVVLVVHRPVVREL